MRDAIADLGQRRPLAAALAIVVGYLAYFVLPAITSSSSFGRGETRTDVGTMTAQGMVELGLALSVLALIWLLRWARPARLTTRLRLRRLWWLLPPMAFMGLLLIVVVSMPEEAAANAPDAGTIASLLLAVALVGLFEELLFRGVLFHGIEAVSGPVRALLLSSLAFGAMHYVNWVSGQPFGDTTFQVLHAAAGGFLYGALMLMTGSIWPGVLLHASWDGLVSLLSTLTATAPMAPGVDASAPASASSGFDPIGFVLLGFEPIYGLIVLLAWLAIRRRRDTPRA